MALSILSTLSLYHESMSFFSAFSLSLVNIQKIEKVPAHLIKCRFSNWHPLTGDQICDRNLITHRLDYVLAQILSGLFCSFLNQPAFFFQSDSLNCQIAGSIRIVMCDRHICNFNALNRIITEFQLIFPLRILFTKSAKLFVSLTGNTIFFKIQISFIQNTTLPYIPSSARLIISTFVTPPSTN
nr:MAG TPA: hypothetical protein [Bacteriophage sp.]